jgi:hypothetical protein
MPFNVALNLDAFAVQNPDTAPPAINAIYFRDGKYDGMARADVAASFAAFKAQTNVQRLALFFHGGLVDKAWGQQGAANQYLAYKDHVFPLFSFGNPAFGAFVAHHLPPGLRRPYSTHCSAILDLPGAESAGSVAAAPGWCRRFELFEPSLNSTDPSLTSATLTSADIDAFMAAVRDDPAIQQEAAAIARTSQGVDALLATDANSKILQLSSRTYLSPEVVSAIRGAYARDRQNIASGQRMDQLDFNPLAALRAAWEVVRRLFGHHQLFERFAGRDHGGPAPSWRRSYELFIWQIPEASSGTDEPGDRNALALTASAAARRSLKNFALLKPEPRDPITSLVQYGRNLHQLPGPWAAQRYRRLRQGIRHPSWPLPAR